VIELVKGYRKEHRVIKSYHVVNSDLSVVREFLTVAEIAEFVGVSQGTIKHAIYNGKPIKEWFIRRIY
jgi:hypothetical protein